MSDDAVTATRLRWLSARRVAREDARARRRAGKEWRVKRACTYKHYMTKLSERVIVYSKVQ